MGADADIFYGVQTVEVGCGTDGGAFDNDVGANERLAGFSIYDLSGDRACCAKAGELLKRTRSAIEARLLRMNIISGSCSR